MKMRLPLFAVALAAPGAMAEENLPAVNALNFSVIVAAGVDDTDSRYLAGGKATFPIGHRFGAQVEAGIANDQYYGIGGHIFWRDPTLGLIGLVGTFETEDDVDLVRGAVEAEAYLGQFTIGGTVGVEQLEDDTAAFGIIVGTFYPDESLALRAAGEFRQNVELARLSAEWQPLPGELNEASIFAEAEYNSAGTGQLLAGIRIHLGEGDFSLQDRERGEDPPFAIFNTIRGGGGPGAANANQQQPDFICTPDLIAEEVCFIDENGQVIF